MADAHDPLGESSWPQCECYITDEEMRMIHYQASDIYAQSIVAFMMSRDMCPVAASNFMALVVHRTAALTAANQDQEYDTPEKYRTEVVRTLSSVRELAHLGAATYAGHVVQTQRSELAWS